MRRWWRSSSGLAAIVSGVLTIATLAIGLAAYAVTHEALEQQLDHRIAIETRALMAEPGADRLVALASAIHRRESGGEMDHLGYLLVAADGTRLAGSLDARVPAAYGYDEFLPLARGRLAQALTTPVPGGGRLVVAADRGALSETDHALLIVFIAALGVLLLIGVGGVWAVGALIRARLGHIDRTALAIIGGDLKQRMSIDGSGSEFDGVSATLNRMLDRIDGLVGNLRQVSSDVAHDLRTPLSRLSNSLEQARTIDDVPGIRTAIDSAADQAAELLEIFNALLRISEVEAMGVRRHFREVALGDALGDLLDTYALEAEGSGHTIRDAVDRTVHLNGDRRLLLQLASNLLDNALRHTPAGTTIQCALMRDKGEIVLRVADDGPGANETDTARLFERFSRAEKTRSIEGHGLGLALVRAIAIAHHGEAQILDAPGFVVEVRFRQDTKCLAPASG